jgi:hypothetical protein
LSNNITGTAVTRGGGGGGGSGYSAGVAAGGTGGGGGGAGVGTSCVAGTDNTGGGGGGDGRTRPQTTSQPGGSGVVIIAYDSTKDVPIISGGLTYTVNDGVGRAGFKVITFTAGTGTVSWA